MAESMTYNSLVSDVQIYAERDDAKFVDQIPRFLLLAENRIAAEVHGLGYRRVVTSHFEAGNPIIEKPVRWRETVEFSYTNEKNERVYLYQRKHNYLRMYWPNQTLRDEPLFYSDYDYEHYFIAPTPIVAREFELHYHERPSPLDESNQTNWTTRYAPQLLLYACLLEAQSFLIRPERTQEFLNFYQMAAAAVAKENMMRLDGDQANVSTEG